MFSINWFCQNTYLFFRSCIPRAHVILIQDSWSTLNEDNPWWRCRGQNHKSYMVCNKATMQISMRIRCNNGCCIKISGSIIHLVKHCDSNTVIPKHRPVQKSNYNANTPIILPIGQMGLHVQLLDYIINTKNK